MSEYIDLSETVTWGPAGPSEGLAVLLPGRAAAFAMPLLLFAGWAAVARGWRVRLVMWNPADEADGDWVAGELRSAIGDHDGRVLVVGKSLATTAAPYVSDQGYDAIWLTPLLHVPEIAEAIAAHPGKQLLVGGTADEAWVSDAAAQSGAEVLEVVDADHGMFVAGDAVRSAEVHVDVVRAIDEFLAGVA